LVIFIFNKLKKVLQSKAIMHFRRKLKIKKDDEASLFIFLISDKSIAIFYHQLATWVPDMACNFYFLKNYKIANNSTTTEAREN